MVIKKKLPVHYLKEKGVHTYFSFVCLIYRPEEYGLLLLSAQTSSTIILAFSQLLSWGPQIVLLSNTEHLSQLNCHTNRFLSDVQFVLGSMPAKTKVSNLKQQTSPCADRNKLLYSKWIRITVDHRSSVWALHKGWKNVPQINSSW